MENGRCTSLFLMAEHPAGEGADRAADAPLDETNVGRFAKLIAE
jgi:hypothetical protein